VSEHQEHVRIMSEAISLGVTGDPERGVALLQPLVDAGPRSTYALVAGLAEVAATTALQNLRPGESFTCPVENVVTGQPASVDVLPPPVRFAAQFVTAWANRDRGMAQDLFDAFAFQSDRSGTPDLAQAIGVLYDMAVTTSTEVVRAYREARGQA
jgi:hypothetical protein